MTKKLATGLFGAAYGKAAKDILSSRFLVSPFSVLNTRDGFWQQRKRDWISIGIKSELGRGFTEEGTAYGSSLGKSGALNARYRDASPGGSPRPAMNQKGHVKGSPILRGDGRGRPLNVTDPERQPPRISDIDQYRNQEKGVIDDEPIGGTSIFDPVLCELVYRWFAPAGGRVLDPFAGGSVRGVVAGELGLQYTGIDLSAVQLEANRKQATDIGTAPRPTWIHGSSTDIVKLVKPLKEFDLVFSCPPYGDLEVYSKDPQDLSNMPKSQFDEMYTTVIIESCRLLKEGSFACFVVGDYRDKKSGMYSDFPGVTIRAFQEAGLHLYNYGILLNAIGSLPLRINQQFVGSRKWGKCHQDILLFCKGDPRDFVKAWPPIDIN